MDVLESRKLMSTSYFVAPWGSDTNAGTSQIQPFKTIVRANRLNLNPGDKLLFAAGQRFTGMLSLDETDAGTRQNPVTIGSYGTGGDGRATIYNANDKGVLIRNAGGIWFKDLIVQGSGPENNAKQGLHFQNSVRTRSEFIRIRNVDVTGWGLFGLTLQGTGAAGFRDVKIEKVNGYNNGNAAISLAGPAGYNNVNQHVYIAFCRLYNNPGRAGRGTEPQGSGIHVAASQDVLVHRCVATNNGWRGNASAGLWTTRSDRVTFQYCTVTDQKANGQDGGGFDLGGGVTNSIAQYNFTRNNHGAGYGMLTWPGISATSNNIIRYNVSQNDARRNSYAGIAITANSGRVNDIYIHNNVVFMSPGENGDPRAIWTHHYIPRITVVNNIFYTTGNVNFSRFRDNSGLRIQGNIWYNTTGNFNLEFNNTNYTSLANFAAATGQEKANGRIVGLNTDPMLRNPGNAPKINNALKLRVTLDDFYNLRPGSPAINRGVTIGTNTASVYGHGTRDFFERRFTTSNNRLDIGVHELVLG